MSIPGSLTPLFNSAGAGGYSISRSLRFNSADSAFFSRTPASAGNRKTWTWAGWVKRSVLGSAYKMIFSAGTESTECSLRFTNSPADALELYQYSGGGFNWQLVTTQVFRDPSAWYHIVAVVDSTQATASNRAKLYINGVQVTAFGTASYPSSNFDSLVNSTTEHGIGRVSASQYFDGYLADIHFIDGQALDPTSFGEFSATTGVWVPKAFTGSYGSQGWHLEFADNSSNTATTLGKDTSGNSPANNWTPNNLSVSLLSYFVDSIGTGLDAYIPAGWARTSDPSTTLTNNQTGVLVDQNGNTYFAIKPTSSTVTIKWIVYDGSGVYNPTVTLSTSRWSGTVTPSVSGAGSTGSPAVGTYSVSVGTTYYVRTGLTGNGNPALVVYITNATIEALGPNTGNDSLVDVPVNGSEVDTGAGGQVRGNYCTWSPLDPVSNSTLANGNLDIINTGDGAERSGTIGVSSGKWYYEFIQTVNASAQPGINTRRDSGASATRLMYYVNGLKYNGATGSSYGATWTTNDVIGIALDLDSGTLTFYKNGVSQGVAFTGLSGTYYPWVRVDTSGSVCVANWGQRPWAYAAPSGYRAWCTANLPAPTIVKPSTVMDAVLYTGDSIDNRAITGLGFSPDLVWFGPRSQSGQDKVLCDSVRGVQKALFSNQTYAEANPALYGSVGSFDANGFTIKKGIDATFGFYQVNLNSSTYVAWCWDAGSSTVTNTAGSISSQVRANASAGFSIVTYSGNSTAGATVGHGLGVAPAFVIAKSRNNSSEWMCYHQSLGNAQSIILNTTAAAGGSSGWNSTSPSSTVITLGVSYAGNFSGYTHVIYAFAPVAGYSSFGSYVGNGSSDGVFVYTGFRPAVVIIKSTGVENWFIFDNDRLGYNPDHSYLLPNSSAAETSFSGFDLLSNGFKWRTNSVALNNNGTSYVYAAFAESPFAYSRAR